MYIRRLIKSILNIGIFFGYDWFPIVITIMFDGYIQRPRIRKRFGSRGCIQVDPQLVRKWHLNFSGKLGFNLCNFIEIVLLIQEAHHQQNQVSDCFRMLSSWRASPNLRVQAIHLPCLLLGQQACQSYCFYVLYMICIPSPAVDSSCWREERASLAECWSVDLRYCRNWRFTKTYPYLILKISSYWAGKTFIGNWISYSSLYLSTNWVGNLMEYSINSGGA